MKKKYAKWFCWVIVLQISVSPNLFADESCTDEQYRNAVEFFDEYMKVVVSDSSEYARFFSNRFNKSHINKILSKKNDILVFLESYKYYYNRYGFGEYLSRVFNFSVVECADNVFYIKYFYTEKGSEKIVERELKIVNEQGDLAIDLLKKNHDLSESISIDGLHREYD